MRRFSTGRQGCTRLPAEQPPSDLTTAQACFASEPLGRAACRTQPATSRRPTKHAVPRWHRSTAHAHARSNRAETTSKTERPDSGKKNRCVTPAPPAAPPWCARSKTGRLSQGPRPERPTPAQSQKSIIVHIRTTITLHTAQQDERDASGSPGPSSQVSKFRRGSWLTPRPPAWRSGETSRTCTPRTSGPRRSSRSRSQCAGRTW